MSSFRNSAICGCILQIFNYYSSFRIDLTLKRGLKCFYQRQKKRSDSESISRHKFRLIISRIFERKSCRNDRSYSEKNVNLDISYYPFDGVAQTLSCCHQVAMFSSGQPQGLPKPQICHFGKHFPADAKLLTFSTGRLQGLPKPHICHFESCSLLKAAQFGQLNQGLSSILSFVRANKHKGSRCRHS